MIRNVMMAGVLRCHLVNEGRIGCEADGLLSMALRFLQVITYSQSVHQFINAYKCQWLLTFVSHTLRGMSAKSITAVYEELGKRISRARKTQGISQEQLATDSAIDRSHMGFIEQGRRKPTVSTLFKITKALNISLEELFKGL
jgi:DNA-binding XRE family transcriptional regulator